MIYRVLERLLRDYLKSRDFGPSPFKQLFLVLWTIFTYKRTTRRMLIFAIVTVAITSLLIRFKLVESDADYDYLVSVVVWACLLYSSTHLHYLYLTVLRLNYKTQKLVWQIHSDTKRLVVPIVIGTVLLLLQLISCVLFVLEMAVRYNDIAPAASTYTVLLFIGYWAMRLMTHVMEGTLLVSVCPLQRTWLAYATRPTKQYLVQLTPMTYYHSTLNYLLSSQLKNINLSYIPSYLTSFQFVYFFIKLTWLTLLSIKVTNKSLLPVTYQPEEERTEPGEGMMVWQPIGPHTQMVPGIERKHVLEGLSEKSLVICGTKMRSEMLHGPPRLTKSPIIRDSFMNESLLHTGYASAVPREQRFSSKNKTLLYSKSNNKEEPANEDSVKDKPRIYAIEDPIFTDAHSYKCPPDCGHEIVERDSTTGVGILAEFHVADDNSGSGTASTLSGFDNQQSLLGNTGSSSRQRTSHRGNQ